jgi:hypothetical protein
MLEPRYANPQGYVNPTQSASLRAGVNKMGSSSVLVNTRESSARDAWDQLEIDLLEAPQTLATPLSCSSGLAPQPARPPASPKVTMTHKMMTLLVNSQWPISNALGVRVTSSMYAVSWALKRSLPPRSAVCE